MSGPILSIDGIRIENTSALAQVLATTKPGQHISVKTTDGTFNLTLAENPYNKSIGFIGIGDVRDINPWYYFWKPTKLTSILREEYAPAEGCIWFLTGLLMWIIFLNFFVGIFNLLPIKPFDGGMLVEAFAKHLIPKHADLLVRAATMFTLTLIFLIFALSI
jgi:membrane-associated protease RseP (regulator of RpoE activity)